MDPEAPARTVYPDLEALASAHLSPGPSRGTQATQGVRRDHAADAPYKSWLV